MFIKAKWIGIPDDFGEICPVFLKEFKINKKISKAVIYISAIGVYEAQINGARVGDFILAPGFTAYEHRLQYQCYDITEYIKAENKLEVTVGTGWHRGRIASHHKKICSMPCAVISCIEIFYKNGEVESILTDDSWSVKKSNVLFSDIYDGEVYDARPENFETLKVKVFDDLSKERLIPQEGELVVEKDRIKAKSLIITPKGERVIDFGQNLAGYVEFSINAKSGDKIAISHAEILDYDGNFYNENYRTAKSKIEYIAKDGNQTYKPHFTFFGFRYIRLDEYPAEIDLEDFTAISIHSDIVRTGEVRTSNEKINQLISNVLWSQKSNFIDIPSDCPQRDERMGWTGDALVFCKTAAYNFDVKRFFEKWINDMCAEQLDSGEITETVPNIWNDKRSSTAWGDAITFIPWEMFLMYGDKSVLEASFDAMKKWVDYITKDTLDDYLWTCPDDEKCLWGKHYGDWLALDGEPGSWKGATNDDFVASAFYARSTEILVKAGKVLGKDVSEYEELYKNIVMRFREVFSEYKTQTAHILALVFNLTENKEKTAKALAEMIQENGNKLNTGFVGTPFILEALSCNGYKDIAYELLLQEEYPSWLYEVNHGATTIWEHWDGIRDDGTLWDVSMNSYNHYAFGSVLGWIYSHAAGIKTIEECPGFKKVEISPCASTKIEWLDCSLKTKNGVISSKWTVLDDSICYEIKTPVPAKIVIDDITHEVPKGKYTFYGKLK